MLPPRIHTSAVIAGIVSFLMLYVALSLGLVFTLSLVPEHFNANWVEQLFKSLGLLTLLFPGYVAARIAEETGLIHGLLTGVGAGTISMIFLIYTFSWEGTDRNVVWLAMVKVVVISIAAGALGGFLGEKRNRSGIHLLQKT